MACCQNTKFHLDWVFETVSSSGLHLLSIWAQTIRCNCCLMFPPVTLDWKVQPGGESADSFD